MVSECDSSGGEENRANLGGLRTQNSQFHQEMLEIIRFLADQGNADGQCGYGVCLRDGKGISTDMKSAAHYFKLSADQGNAVGQ
jgi:TPR repeat protein